MRRNVRRVFGLIVLLGCGDSNEIEGLTDECILEPIVRARLARGAVNCSSEFAFGEEAVPIFVAVERADDDAAVQCIRAALASGNDAVFLSELVAATDSLAQSAKFVSANGKARYLTYDSSPSGQGIGDNTVLVRDCEPFDVAPTLGCSSDEDAELVCTHDDKVRASFR